VWYPGSSPISIDGTVMRIIENTNACFRPNIRSPISPNKIAPNGLIKKAARYTPKELISCSSFDDDGKKLAPISGASNPYTAKSYLRQQVAQRERVASENQVEVVSEQNSQGKQITVRDVVRESSPARRPTGPTTVSPRASQQSRAGSQTFHNSFQM